MGEGGREGARQVGGCKAGQQGQGSGNLCLKAAVCGQS